MNARHTGWDRPKWPSEERVGLGVPALKLAHDERGWTSALTDDCDRQEQIGPATEVVRVRDAEAANLVAWFGEVDGGMNLRGHHVNPGSLITD